MICDTQEVNCSIIYITQRLIPPVKCCNNMFRIPDLIFKIPKFQYLYRKYSNTKIKIKRTTKSLKTCSLTLKKNAYGTDLRKARKKDWIPS